MTVNLGGERGGWSVPRYQATHQEEDGNQVREGKVTTVYSYFEIQINLPWQLKDNNRKIFYFYKLVTSLSLVDDN